MTRRLGFVVLLVFGSPALHATALTMPDYMRAVLAYSPEIRQSEQALIAADDAYKALLSSLFLPGLNLSITDIAYGDDPKNGFHGGIRIAQRDRSSITTLNWNVFNGFQDLMKARYASDTRDTAAMDLEIQKQSQALAAIQAFYSLAATDQLLEVALLDLHAQEDQYNQTQQLYKVGMKGLSDVYKSETEWHASEVRLISAQAARQNARKPFNSLIGRAPWTPAEITADLELGATDLPRLEEDAARLVERRPELANSRRALHQAEIAATQSLLSSLPTLSANASWTKTDAQGAGLWTGRASQQVGLTLSLPLSFNAITQAYSYAAARAARRQAQAQFEMALRDNRNALYSAWLSLEAATKTYALSVRQEEIAQRGLEIVEAQYRQGATDALRMAQARSDLLSARVQRATTLQGIFLSRAAYRRAAGVSLW